MKITRKQLKKIISEATREFRVKPVSDEQYAKDVASLPEPMQAVATGQETSASPKRAQHRVGNFFMTQGVDYKIPKGYRAIKYFIDFYMILPDGEAIQVNPSSFIIEKVSEGIRFLNILNQYVTPLPIESEENKSIMRSQAKRAMEEYQATMP